MPKRLWMAIAAFALLITASAAACADPLPINQLPMYGGRAKTDEMKSADADFIASMEKRGLSRAEGARQMLGRGWAAWSRKDMTTAMARNARSNMAFMYYLKNDFANACTWAREARINGDELEKGFLEEMCSRGGKSDEGKPASPAGPPA